MRFFYDLCGLVIGYLLFVIGLVNPGVFENAWFMDVERLSASTLITNNE